MTFIDQFARLCGTGQAVTATQAGAVSSAWIDMGTSALNQRIFGGGQLVVARFACTVTATTADPDNTIEFQIVHSPKELATPTTARTLADFNSTSDVDDATETITSAAHGLPNGTRITVVASSGALPTGLVTATNYYIRNATTNTFQLATAPGGAAINLTDAVGTTTVTWYPEVIVSTGQVAFNRLIANDWVREIGIGPAELSRVYPTGRYLYAMFRGVSDLSAGTFTCDLTSGFAMDGRPFNKPNYVTA